MVKIRPAVVANAGPIIHLDELACLDILADFGKVYVPESRIANAQEQHEPQSD